MMLCRTMEPMKQGATKGGRKAVVVDEAATDGNAVAGVEERASAAGVAAAAGVAGDAAAAGDFQVAAEGPCLMIEVAVSRTGGQWSRG